VISLSREVLTLLTGEVIEWWSHVEKTNLGTGEELIEKLHGHVTGNP